MRGSVVAGVGVLLVVFLVLGGGVYGSAPILTPVSGDGDTIAGSSPTTALPGSSTGCTEPDPTRADGCLTPAMAWLLKQTRQHFGELPSSCWDAHAWNPTSDHPQGRACDFTISTAGQFPDAAGRAHGWQIADWLTANAAPLDVAYVIWDGRIWSAVRAREGWRPYEGGKVYDVSTPTGGHYDHVHVSVSS